VYSIRIGVRQDTVLVVVDERVTQREAGGFETEGGTVCIRHFGAVHLDVVHGQVVAVDDPDALAAGALAGCVDFRTTVDTADRQVVAHDVADVAAIGGVAGDFDDVAILGGANRGAGGGVSLARADRQRGCGRGAHTCKRHQDGSSQVRSGELGGARCGLTQLLHVDLSS
jgi:hypothetical protein